jgi:hypothetical protein
VNDRSKSRSRLIVIVLVVIFAAPMTVSWLLFRFTDVGRGSGGHGDLIQPPRPLPDMPLADPAGAAGRLHGKWTLLYLAPAECTAPCADALQRMRQVRLALGTDADRVQRVLILAGREEPPSGQLAESWPGLYVLIGAGTRFVPIDTFSAAAGEDPLSAGRLYLIDPLGMLMMSYPPQADPAGIIKDLKRLLRYSRIG